MDIIRPLRIVRLRFESTLLRDSTGKLAYAPKCVAEIYSTNTERYYNHDKQAIAFACEYRDTTIFEIESKSKSNRELLIKKNGIVDMWKTNNIRPKVWVHPKCITSRDVIRNTYDIVRNVDTADIVVMPSIKSHKFDFEGSRNCIIATSDKNMFLIELIESYRPKYYGSGYVTESDTSVINNNQTWFINELRKWFKRCLGEDLVSFDFHFNKNITIFPAYEPYIDTLTKTSTSQMYILENDLPMDMPNKITAESLSILHRSNDFNMMSKMIISSDYEKYPITVREFLRIWWDRERADFMRDNKLRAVWEAVNNIYDNGNGYISPKDYEMMQDYLMRLFGIDEMGYLSDKKMNSYDHATRQLVSYLPHMMAIKKGSIDHVEKLIDVKW